MSYLPNQGLVSTINSTGGTITAGSSWTGAWEDISAFAAMSVIGSASTVTTLYYDFSSDGVAQDRNVQLSDGTNGSLGIHGLTPVTKYGRARVVAGTGSSVTFTVQTLMSVSGRISQPTSRLSQSMSDYSDVINSRSVAVAQTPAGTYTNTKQDGLGFSTTSLLTSGQTYSSGILSLVGYTQVQTDILSVGANGTITIRFYEDAAGTNLLRTLTSTYTSGDGFKLLSAPAFTPYVKYDFTCTSTGQTQFYFDTKFTTKSISGQIINLTDGLSSGMVANLGRNVIVGKSEGGDYYQNISANGEGHLEVSIQGPRSAFGEISMVEPTPVAQIDFVYGLNTQTSLSTTTNGGSVTTTASTLSISTAAATGSTAMVTSTRYLKYRAGQGAMARYTALFNTGVADSLQYAGIGTASLNNGYFFGYSGTSFGIIHKNINSSDIFYPQSEWTEDVCSGVGGVTNKSGINLNPQKGNVYQIKYQYLGFGNIYFYIENGENGQFTLVHQIKYPNRYIVTSLQQPSLNLLWRVENQTNNTVINLKAGSGSIFLEGERKFLGPKYGIDNNKSLGANTSTSVLAIRNATTYNGITNRAQVRLRTISLASDMGNTASGIQVLQVHKNPEIGGTPVYTPINGITADNGVTITNGGSVVSYDTVGTTVTPITTGSTPSYVLFNTNVGRNGNVVVDVSDLDIYMNPGDIFVFMIKTVAGGTQQANVSINWVEDI